MRSRTTLPLSGVWVAPAIDTFVLVSLASRSYTNYGALTRTSKWPTRSIKPSIANRVMTSLVLAWFHGERGGRPGLHYQHPDASRKHQHTPCPGAVGGKAERMNEKTERNLFVFSMVGDYYQAS